MKIRNGFVSNSSSSSFIMRAAKFTRNELIEALEIPQSEVDECDSDWDIYDLIGSNLPDGLSIESTGNFFDGQDFENLIIGKSYGYLEDGQVTELKEHDSESDKEILDKLENIGLSPTGLKTYIQMVSNDNY